MLHLDSLGPTRKFTRMLAVMAETDNILGVHISSLNYPMRRTDPKKAQILTTSSSAQEQFQFKLSKINKPNGQRRQHEGAFPFNLYLYPFIYG